MNQYTGLLPDSELLELANSPNPIIEPFLDSQVKFENGKKIVSKGLSSYGYDLTLADHDFKVLHCSLFERFVNWAMRFVNPKFATLDPKNVDESLYKQVELQSDSTGKYYWLPGNTSALAVAVEKFAIPPDVMGIVSGKSTYARVSINCLVTPLEAGWIGYLTLELANNSPYPVKIYANEGIAQVVFYRGNPCNTTYADRCGKYQNQAHKVTHSRV